MTLRHTAIALMLLVALASCSSSAASRRATSEPPPSTVPVNRTAAKVNGATMHWRADTRLGPSGAKQCDASQQCVLPGTATDTLDGDLRGTSISGNSSTFNQSGVQIASSRTDVFQGTVKGCGSGSLVLVGTETFHNDLHTSTGDWRIVPGFGTGALAHVTGHGTGEGGVNATGFHSQWQGVIDCGK